MKKISVGLVVSALLVLMMSVCVWGASTGSKATGAKLPKYKKVVERTVDVSSDKAFSTSLMRYLEEAGKKASKKTQYKIIIPPGTYTAIYWQNVPSNTWIYAEGATIRALKGKKSFVFLTNQKILENQPISKKHPENIIIEGGTWDTTTQSENDSPVTAPFRFAHVKNLVFKNMTVKCNRKEHLIELADINGLTIENCDISGNSKSSGLQPKEAIQLDVATESAMVNMKPYNGKGCHNVIIANNKFHNVARGVGSHNVKEGAEANPYTDVTVTNNSFKSLQAEAIFIQWWKNCTITKNTITNGKRTGIYMESSSKIRVMNNKINKIYSFTGERKATYGSETAGIILRDSSNNNVQNNTVSKCKGEIVRIENTYENSCKKNTIKKNKKK